MLIKDAVSKKKGYGDTTSALVGEFSVEMEDRQVLRPDIGQSIVNFESAGAVERDVVADTAESIRDSFESVVAKLGIDLQFEEHNVEAATMAALLATGGRNALSRKVQTPTSTSGDVKVVDTVNVEDAYTTRHVNLEAYDETENKKSAVFSFFYNLLSSLQAPVAELFFPTVVISPDQQGLEVNVTLLRVYDEVEHKASGALAEFKFKNVLRAYRDHTVLKNDITRIVPVYQASSAANFMDPALLVGTPNLNANGVFDEEVGGEIVETAPLKPGVRLDLLGISQTAALTARGVIDETDAIDSSAYLSSIYVLLGDDGAAPPGDADVLKIDTRGLPGANFTYGPQGDYRNLILAMDTDSVVISNPVCLDGAAPSTVTWPAGYSARFRLEASGQIQQQTGRTVVYITNFQLEGVYDAAGNPVPATDANYTAIQTIANAMQVVGYELETARTNTNRRQRGQIIDVNVQTTLYPVKLRSPISSIKPVGYGDDQDIRALEALNTTTRIRTSKDAITALLDAASVLSAWQALPNANNELPEVLGVGRYIVRPYYATEALDLVTIVDSVMSSNRDEDIRAALMGKIMNHAYRMWSLSEYGSAFESLAGAGTRPTVIVATDTVLGYYLSQTEGRELSNEAFDVRIATDQDSRLSGKIFISFGVFNDSRNKAPNPLGFGNMAWAPEMTAVLPVSRNGQISKEMTVVPRYQHIVHLPVLAELTVSNLETVLSKVTINNAV